jgi:hypothetical protein
MELDCNKLQMDSHIFSHDPGQASAFVDAIDVSIAFTNQFGPPTIENESSIKKLNTYYNIMLMDLKG